MTTVLNGQLAVITGASGGIGSAIATALAEHGTLLWVCGRNRAKLEALAKRLRHTARSVSASSCDLANEADINSLCAGVAVEHGRVDILVHCAGVIEYGRLADAPVAALDRQYYVNVRGPLLLTQRLVPLLKRPGGQIVFINSSASLNSSPQRGYYSATKQAMKALADTIRLEMNSEGIRVMSVFPGTTATPLTAARFEEAAQPYRPERLLQPEDVASVVVNALMMPWTAEVTDISIRSMQKWS